MNRAFSEWSQICHPRGIALNVLFLKALECLNWEKITFGLGQSNIVFQTTFAVNRKESTLTTGLTISGIL